MESIYKLHASSMLVAGRRIRQEVAVVPAAATSCLSQSKRQPRNHKNEKPNKSAEITVDGKETHTLFVFVCFLPPDCADADVCASQTYGFYVIIQVDVLHSEQTA